MSDLALLFFTIPVITALIGWGTNWAAVKMIFHPERFVGIGPIGWQGILTRQAPKFAHGVADMVTDNLLDSDEMLSRIDVAELEALLGDSLDAETEVLVRDCGEVIRPGAWDAVPPAMKPVVLMQVKQKSREMVAQLKQKIQDVLSQTLDISKLIVASLTGENIRTMVRLTKYIGRKEFKFIEYYGGVFGLLIGLVQAALWSSFQRWWLLPLVGALVGLVTNWLAIQMIFRPLEPKRYLGLFNYQGLFPKRQPQISADYGKIASEEILTPERLLGLVTEGDNSDQLAKLIGTTISQRIDTEWNQAKAALPVEVSDAQIDRIKRTVLAHLAGLLPKVRPVLLQYIADKVPVGELIEKRMAALPKDRFERILRGIFEEDEIILIAVGGVLGLGVGFLQALLVLTIQ